MKKFDIKKVGIVVAIIVVVVLAIFLIGKLLKGNVDEESLKQYEKVTIEYYLNLTAGLNTAYDGVEALYEVDETKLQDINIGADVGITGYDLDKINIYSTIV